MITVTALSVTAVKGTRLQTVDAVELVDSGARGDRRFYVIDGRGRVVNGKVHAELQTVVAAVEGGSLSLTFPDGGRVVGEIAHDGELTTRFFSRPRQAHALSGPFSEALSEYLGAAVRIVEPRTQAVDRGRQGGASLISRASLARLAEAAEVSEVDARRFRMLVEIDGVEPHAEDRWVGREVRVGDATVRFRGNVGRCLVTGLDPDSGKPTLPTLDVLRGYRGDLHATEPLPFGVYGEVVAAAPVRVGDEVVPLD